MVVGGVERQGPRFSLSHIGEREWRAYFMSPMFAPAGLGVAKTPSRAVQQAAGGGGGAGARVRGHPFISASPCSSQYVMGISRDIAPPALLVPHLR